MAVTNMSPPPRAARCDRWIILAVALALLGCSNKKNGAPAPPGATATDDRAGAGDPGRDHATDDESPAGPGALCIDLSDLQIEPLDLEALQDEMPTVALSGSLAAALESAAAYGTPIPLGGGRIAVPVVRCDGPSCRAGILVVDGAGAERGFTPLPGLDDFAFTDEAGDRAAEEPSVSLPVGRPEVELVAALADVNSDGSADLWVGYQRPGKSGYHAAAFALPAMTLQWHGVISTRADGAGDGACEGALYPADADCDGDGDVVLLQQCGPIQCLGDRGDGNPGCRDAQVSERASVHRWDPAQARYLAGDLAVP